MRSLTIALLLGLMASIGYLHYGAPECREWCETMHMRILNGTAIAPYRYRILGALAADVMPGGTLSMRYAMAHMVILPLAFGLVFQWLKEEAGEKQALIGLFVLLSAYLLAYHVGAFGLNSHIEIAFIAIALLLLRHNAPLFLYVALIIAGTLNRETTGAILLLLLWGKSALIQVWGACAFALVFFAMRILLGTGAGTESVMDIVRGNLNPVRLALAILNNLPFLALIALALRGRHTASIAFRRLALVSAAYVPLVIMFGYWNEVRLWLPLVVLALPVIVSSLSPDAISSAHEQHARRSSGGAGRWRYNIRNS